MGSRGSEGAQLAAACTKTPGAGVSRIGSGGRGWALAQAVAQMTRRGAARDVTRPFFHGGRAESEAAPLVGRPRVIGLSGWSERLHERFEQLRPVFLQFVLADSFHAAEIGERSRSRCDH